MQPLFRREPDKQDNCPQHGTFTSHNVFRNVWSRCPGCSIAQKKAEIAEQLRSEAEKRGAEWQRKLCMAAIPERFAGRTLDTYRADNDGQKRALAFCRTYAAQFDEVLKTGRSAIFCGKPGTGKTHLANGIALEIMKPCRIALFITAQRAIRRIKDSWSKDSVESESDVIRLLVSPDLLILDEIGVQFGTEFERNLIFDILNERYEKRLPCLLLSNLSVEEIRPILGERIFDRLREDGGKCIVFDWASAREVMK
jgi:DNA replication protein DnaC